MPKPASRSLACALSDATIPSPFSMAHWGSNDGYRSAALGAARVAQAVRIVSEARRLNQPGKNPQSRAKKKTDFHNELNLLADETVLGEPVCEANSLLTGKITGNFTKIGPFGETLPVRTQQNQLVAGKFPTK